MKLYVTNHTQGMTGVGKLRFPVGLSTVSDQALSRYKDHPGLRARIAAGELSISDQAPGSEAPPPAVVVGPPQPEHPSMLDDGLTDEERADLARLEAEDLAKKSAQQ